MMLIYVVSNVQKIRPRTKPEFEGRYVHHHQLNREIRVGSMSSEQGKALRETL